MKKIELLFYKTNPSPKNIGIKHVLWEVADSEGTNTYDWGFAVWDGAAWEDIEVPHGFTTQIHSWANTVDPAVLIKDAGKIISL